MNAKIETIAGIGLCEQHGEYRYMARQVGKSIVGKVCPECLKLGLRQSEQKNVLSAQVRAAAESMERQKNAGVPPAFQNCHQTAYQAESEQEQLLLNTIGAYVANFGKVLQVRPAAGMVFTGGLGSGKTHLGCSMICRLLEKGFSAAYISAPQYLTAVEDARHGRHDLSASRLIASHAKPSLLVIDEYGAHSFKDHDYQALFSLIDLRYQANLPTVLITNLTYRPVDGSAKDAQALSGAAQVEQVIDGRLIERIRGNNGPVFSFSWPSRRRTATQSN